MRPLDIKYQSKKNINMVPLINIVFLLLVFFMLAGSIKNEGKIEYEPPESNTSQSLNKIEPYILISSNNKYFYFELFGEFKCSRYNELFFDFPTVSRTFIVASLAFCFC